LVTTRLFQPKVADTGVVIEMDVLPIEFIVAAAPPTVTPVVPVKSVPVITVTVPPALKP
jgi:hypothetical protein